MAEKTVSKSAARLKCTDIARIARVAPSTVSRVLNGRDRVSAETRQRVMETIRSTGYKPFGAGATLATRRSGTIALISEKEAEYNYRSLLLTQSLSVELVRERLRLAIDIVERNCRASDIEEMPVMQSISFDGVVIDIHHLGQELSRTLDRLSIPYVLVNPAIPQAQNTIMPADEDAGRKATNYLIERGHRRIGFLYVASQETQPYPHPFPGLRKQGYIDAMINAGLRPVIPQVDVPPGTEKKSRYYVPVLKEFRENHNCSAVVTNRPLQAASFLRVAYNEGVRVPEDLSIIACDYNPALEFTQVPISAVKLDRGEMGRLAGQMIQRRIEEGADQKTIYVGGKLVEHRSVRRFTE